MKIIKIGIKRIKIIGRLEIRDLKNFMSQKIFKNLGVNFLK